jgi:peptidyl-prolyl cis-trans isomerase-like protein 2
MSGGFTSSSMDPATVNQLRQFSTLETLQERWKLLSSCKKDGLVKIVTSEGTMMFKLFFTAAPAACDNFATLCERGFYNGVGFHRLIPGFMLQGGDPTGTGRGGQTAWEGVEKFPDDVFNQNCTHSTRGVLSMANSGPNTNSSQFFITFKATPHLDRKHTVFGTMLAGRDVLDRIEKIPADSKDVPTLKISILSTEVVEKPTLKEDVEEEEKEDNKKVVIERPAIEKITSSTAVGSLMKKLGSGGVGLEKRKRSSAFPPSSSSQSSSLKKKKKKFGKFDGW